MYGMTCLISSTCADVNNKMENNEQHHLFLITGIGWAVVLIAFYTDFFYNVVIAWALHFFFASFTRNLPWDTCNNDWNTPLCYEGIMDPPEVNTSGTNITTMTSNMTEQRVSPAHEYFE